MMPWAGQVPRRARQLIPRDLPRRTEVLAACTVAVLVAHLLLAQLTLVLAIIFAVIGKASRWRAWWLLVPAATGLAWTLAAGPGNAIAGFTAGPSGILWHLAGGHLAGQAGRPLAGFSGAQSWLPRQFPIALICGAVEAALIGWLDWLHTDEWAVPPPRPGLVAVVRRAVATRTVRAGGVVTREGCALGVVPATGAVAELRWAEASRGTLIVGAADRDVTLAGLQVVHAALRRRKPLIVLDHDPAVARALRTACLALGVPLLTNDAGEPGHAGRLASLPSAPAAELADWLAADLGSAVRERSAVLLPASTPELASRACAGLAELATRLGRIAVDADALVWVPRGDQVPPPALAAVLRDGPGGGMTVLIGTTSPTAAVEFAGLVGAALMYRVADPELAASLAIRTGTRLLPASAAALVGQRPDAVPWPTAPAPGGPVPPGATATPGGAVFPGQAVSHGAAISPGTAVFPGAAGYPNGPVPSPADLVPSPMIPARALLTLGRAEFVLAADWPRRRLIAPGRMVPARLPRLAGHPAAPQESVT